MTVAPTKSIARPGEPIAARVEARYYFGAPVAGGEVVYRIFRQEEKRAYAMPAEYDWLYGDGYGEYSSAQQHDAEETLRWGSNWTYRTWEYAEPRERIEEGRARLDDNGKAEIRFEPAALPLSQDRDWRYTIEVLVRDESRRTVEGAGVVTAPRQEFHAIAAPDRGWHAPGDPVTLAIHARSPSGVPVASAGTVTLSRLEQKTRDAPPAAEQIQEWSVATGTDGRHELKLTAPRAGRYQIQFRTHDSWNREVSATASFWIYGSAADFGQSPCPALEIIADRRTYRVGETAHLLVVTNSPGGQVLLCDKPDEYRMFSMSNRVQVLDLPISEKDVPRLYVEGTVVRDGVVHTETCQLLVPPVRDLLKVELSPERPVQKPGETGRLAIKVTDGEGRPITGEVALTAFDKALTYIQPDAEIGPMSLVAARKAADWYRYRGVLATLDPRKFGTSGEVMCPEYYVTDDYVPAIGGMGGSPPQGGDPGDADASRRGPGDRLQPGDIRKGALAAPTVRTDFSDTALWQPHLKLDEAGRAETEIKFPQSLTTWRIRGYVVTKDTRVGDVVRDVATTKNLLVRLQRPRFLVERDEVVLSANVHNNLPRDKGVTAELLVPAAVFRASSTAVPDAEGTSPQASVARGQSASRQIAERGRTRSHDGSRTPAAPAVPTRRRRVGLVGTRPVIALHDGVRADGPACRNRGRRQGQ